MDLASIIGLVAGLSFILMAIITADKSELGYFLDLTSALVTFGGTFSATLMNFPLSDMKGVGKVVIKAFVVKPTDPKQLIQDCRRYAELARRDGILALENIIGEIKDPFLVKGIQLSVDGTDPDLIRQMMDIEMDNLIERHEKGKKIFDSLAKYCPSFGMIGTLIGLIVMMNNLGDPKALGSGMGIALITTLYGAIGAYMIFYPIADKLDARSKEEIFLKEMIIKGVLSIQSGDNPRVVEQKLKVFLPPNMRE